MSSYTGMNAATGRAIDDADHIRQSIIRILATPQGSRIERREFGSILPDLIDRPLNGKTRMQAMAATVMALTAWEPRIELTRVMLQTGSGESAGSLTIDIDARRRGTGHALQYSLPLKG
ncbi:GPW/gp25 family protein [Chromobacterium sp. IIBBL 290-4]|uniref:GPW/gp25 family protein n=1 Tax=Chromobacterium sp. IIBBL 290-4 TaxID=2953890 RepID=UPI0020B8FC7F|nr:GPW/gp25 family protein [Chromobacterium sp. IIBBL 290-4]UTH73344.1 GPW/gp25 family protein [Chromobacterium sp. IIBBL 290-4]